MIDGLTTSYTYSGSLLMRETNGYYVIDYAYDAAGNAVGLKYNGTPYFYRRNLQGDVVAIVDASGSLVAEYTYDAWGTVLSASGYLAGANPIRYRGYYYDSEIGSYYLQTRYYSTKWKRFWNADCMFIAGRDVLNATNMYSYCNGNPVMYRDPTGMDSQSDMIALLLFSVFVVPAAIVGFLQNFFSDAEIDRLLAGAESYAFQELHICTDGEGSGQYGKDDPKYFGGTKFGYTVNRIWQSLNPLSTRYAVLPPGYKGNAKLGDIAILVDFQKLTFSIGIIGDKGPTANDFSEVSLAMAWDLGYNSSNANGKYGPEGDFGMFYIPGTGSIAGAAGSVAKLIATFRNAGHWLTEYS